MRGTRGKRRGHNHRHTVAKVITASLLTLAGTTAATVVTVYNDLNGNIEVVNVDDQLGDDRPPAGPEGPLNVLVMGSDTREGDNNIDGLAGGGERSDTTILLHLSADRKRAYGVSIPRDIIVDRPTCYDEDGTEIPGASDAIWNAAFAVGGPACTIRQLEQLSGIRVDNYAVVDFTGFKEMTEAIGGVEVCIPEEIDDPDHDITLAAGTREVEGDEALAYVRVRYGVGDGSDPNRIKRQQAFMASMMNKVVSGGMLSRPDKVVGFLNAATNSLQTDVTSVGELAGLGLEFQDVGLSNIKFVTTPWGAWPEDPNRIVWTSEVEQLWEVVREDRPLPPELADDSISAADEPDGSTAPSADATGDATGDDATTEPPAADDPTSEVDDEATGETGPDQATDEDGSGLSDADRRWAGLCT